MQIFRRFLVLAAVSFWLGGFTFYASVVVPIGQHVLGSHLRQGLITQQVTHYLNLSGAIALLVFAWDNWATSRLRLARWLTWLGMLGPLPVLVWLHGRLDARFDTENWGLVDPAVFRSDHRWYLWISAVQWGFGLAYLALTLLAWRGQDGAVSTAARTRDEEAQANSALKYSETVGEQSTR
jgi:hypothetical protein